MSAKNRKPGFTLTELLVALIISAILIAITVSIYGLFRKSLILDQSRANLNQNARVALDRLSRELRQAPVVVTTLPSNPSDHSVSEPNQIEFEDGHAQDGTYRVYYLSGSTLQIDTKEYHLSGSPSTRVRYSTQPPAGQSLQSDIITTQTIAENVQSFSVYGNNPVEVILVASDGSQSYTLRTYLYRRNQ